MAIDYAKLPRAQVEAAVLRMSFEDRATDVRSMAIRAVNAYHKEVAAQPLDEATFNAAVLTMVSVLDTAMPSVPNDLATLSDSALATLANSLDLAEWDWRQRLRIMEENHAYWVRRATQPTAAVYLAMWKTMVNYVRAKRGLAAIP